MSAEKTKPDPSLSGFLEEDREHVLSELRADPSGSHARQVLEKETERLMIRAAQADMGEDAQHMLVTVRNTLPILESVSDAEQWRRTEEKKSRPVIPLPAVVFMAAGAALILFGRGTQLSSVLMTAAGLAGLGGGAFLAGKGMAGGSRDTPSLPGAGASQWKFLVDPDNAFHVLTAVTLAADHSLEQARGRTASADPDSGRKKDLQRSDIEFYSELLEYAYRLYRTGNEEAGEQIENIRYYLHSMEIDTTDYSPENAGFFELLPGGQPMTIRPALTKDGTVLRRGIACV